MIRRLAMLLLGKRECGELGYYKRLRRVEERIKKGIQYFVAVVVAALLLGWLIVAALTEPMETYSAKDGYADGTGIHYELTE